MSRPAAVAVVMTALDLLLVAFVWSVVPPVAEQTGRFFADLPALLGRLSEQSRPLREVTDGYPPHRPLERAGRWPCRDGSWAAPCHDQTGGRTES
jgi:hypothetical protein